MVQKLCSPGRWAVVVGLLAFAVDLTPVTAQEQHSLERVSGGSSERQPGGETTAEEVLRALQRERPPNDVIQPTGSTAHLRRATHGLLPEGASVVDRTGHIERRNDDWVFVADDTDGATPLLRNATLEVVIRTAAGAVTPISFVVSGEVSVFRGRNYLLLRSAMRANPPAAGPIKTIENGAQSTTVPSTKDDAHGSPPPVEAVLEAIRNKRPEREAIAPDGPLGTPAVNHRLTTGPQGVVERGLGQPWSADAESHRTLQPDGTILPRRAGRVVPQGDRWFFTAESDHPDHPEPPRELLPCRATEFMLSRWELNPHGLVFVVTGEITLFDGVNYLLPRVAIRQPASDNLRK